MDDSDLLTLEEQRAVVSHLYDLTLDGRVKWNQGDRDDVFMLSMGEHSYRLSSKDEDGLLPYQIEIFVPAKEERLATILTRGREARSYDDSVTRQVREIYETAWRITHRSESSIKALLSELDKIDKGELPPF